MRAPIAAGLVVGMFGRAVAKLPPPLDDKAKAAAEAKKAKDAADAQAAAAVPARAEGSRPSWARRPRSRCGPRQHRRRPLRTRRSDPLRQECPNFVADRGRGELGAPDSAPASVLLSATAATHGALDLGR